MKLKNAVLAFILLGCICYLGVRLRSQSSYIPAMPTGAAPTCDANLTDLTNILTYTPGSFVLGNAYRESDLHR